MKRFLFGLILSVTIISCKNEKVGGSQLADLIPANSLYIVDTPDIGNFLLQTDTVPFYNTYGSFFTSEIKAQLQTLTNVSNQKSSIVSIFKGTKEDHYNYVFIAKNHPGKVYTDSVRNKSIETFTYKDFTIQKHSIEDITFYNAEKKGVFIASDSRQKLEQILEKEHKGLSRDTIFIKAHSAIDLGKTALLLRSTALENLLNLNFTNIVVPKSDLARWSVIELDSRVNGISLNGISTWGREDKNFLDLFRNTGTHVNGLAKIAPRDSRGFISFTFNDMDVLHSNLNNLYQTETTISADHFLHYSKEAGMITLKNDSNLPALRALDLELAREVLIPEEEADSFRGISLYKAGESSDILSYLYPLLPEVKVSYYIWIEDFIIFAENKGDLEMVISAYLNNLTLGQQEYYIAAMENLAAASSILLVSNDHTQILSAQSSGNSLTDGEKSGYPIAALQFVVEKDFAHVHGSFGQSGDFQAGTASQIASFNVESGLGTLPFMVKNHMNNQAEVLVQDGENTLHLFSSTGALIWKKQFPHQIMGEIHQVDVLKNGNLQYAFTTPYALHIIDRKGNPLKPFPLEFREEITQPLAVFDYDNNRTYRFVIAQGNNVLMYDPKGKLVKGFDFDRLSSQIVQPPKHIRLNNKDYILVPESSGKLNILSRQGKSRIDVKSDIDLSAAGWFAYKNNFLSVSAKGELITIDESGNVVKEVLGGNGDIKVAAGDNVLVTMADNTLKINDHAINLDYGLYSNPAIFRSGGKTYISITDIQAQRIYIFDENARLLPGFPLYGNSEISVFSHSNIFSVQGGENEIILYRF